MRKITIISNGTLPVPAVKGGAVENLLETFINLNEIYNDFELTIISISNNEAVSKIKYYKRSKFIFIDSKKNIYKIKRGIRYLLNRSKIFKVKNQYINCVLSFKEEFVNADIILIENNPNYIPLVRKITSKSIGLHLHNDYLNITNNKFSSNILADTNFVIAVSNYIKFRVSEVAPINCKINLLFNGINLDRFNKDNEKQSKRDIVILFTGRLQKSKGVKLLIEVFIEILELGVNNVKLLIVGASGFGESKKSKFIQDIELLSKKAFGKINFTGYIDYSEIHEVYKLADIAVFPSLAPEAFPLTTIEALASGLPIIVSDAGGMPEGVDEKCGVIVKRGSNMKQDLKTELLRLINDKGLRIQMSIEAKTRAKKFNDIEYYKSFVSILNNVTI